MDVVARVEEALGRTPSPYFLSGFGIVEFQLNQLTRIEVLQLRDYT